MRRPQFDFGLLLALFIPIFAIAPLLIYPGLPNTADGPVHLMRQVQLNEAWAEGNFYPRWGTDLAFGHGMPIFSYAPPSLYHLTQLFHLSGLPLDAAMKTVVGLDFLLYSVGMFLLTRRIFGPYPALIAATLHVYAPYRLREAYIQGNYGQFTGLAWYPLIFWAFHGLIMTNQPRYLLAAAGSLAMLLFSHNISAMLFAPFLAAYLLGLLLLRMMQKGQGRSMIALAWGRTVVAGLLGLGLAAIFWLPAFGERHDIKLEGITQGFFDFRENFITLPELLATPVPLDRAAINPEFPLSLGLAQIGGAILGLLILLLWLLTRHHRPARPVLAHTLFFTLFLSLYLFLALPYSQAVWETVPLLELTEFPWRMLGPAIFCASVLSGAAFFWLREQLLPTRYRLLLVSTMLMIIALNLYYLYPAQFIEWGTPGPADAFAYEVASGAIGTTSTGEFLPRAAQQHPQPDTLWPDYAAGQPPRRIDPATLPPEATVRTIAHQAEADMLHVTTPQPFTATLRLLYWPGWRLYLNGEPHPFTLTPQTGLLQTRLPTGAHTLTLQLETTPLRQLGRWLTAGALLGMAVMYLLLRRHADADDKERPPAPITPQFAGGVTMVLLLSFAISRPLEPLFTLQSDPNAPQLADRVLQADFGEQIRLVGMETLPTQEIMVQPEQEAMLRAVVYWRALLEVPTNYAVFLHLDAPNGETFATVDERHPEDIPTRNWPPGLYLRNPLHLHLPPDLPPIRYTLTVGLYDPETGTRLSLPGDDERTAYPLGHIWLTEPPPPMPAQPLAQFGETLTLWHVDTAEGVTLYWQTAHHIEADLSIFVHALDEAGNLIAQADGVPYGGLYPLPHWLPGQIIRDSRPLATLPAATHLAIGLYNPQTGQRLPATTATGAPLPDNRFMLPLR